LIGGFILIKNIDDVMQLISENEETIDILNAKLDAALDTRKRLDYELYRLRFDSKSADNEADKDFPF